MEGLLDALHIIFSAAARSVTVESVALGKYVVDSAKTDLSYIHPPELFWGNKLFWTGSGDGFSNEAVGLHFGYRY